MGRGLAEDIRENYNESVNAFSIAILLNPDSYYAWYSKGIDLRNRANIAGKESDIFDSIDAFDKSSKSKEEEVTPQMRSLAFVEKGKTIEMLNLNKYENKLVLALDAYNNSNDYFENAEAYFGKGRMLYLIGKGSLDNLSYIKAEEAYDKAIHLDPLNAEYHNGKANALFAQGEKKLNASLLEYENSIILDPDLAAAYKGKGNVLFQKKDYCGALSAYNTANEKDPNENLYRDHIQETRDAINSSSQTCS